MLVAATLTGCADDGEQSADDTVVSATLAFSVSPNSVTTRTSADVVQAGGQFRGLQDMKLIPFAKQGRVEPGDQPKIFGLDAITQSSYAKTGSHFYFFDGCQLMTGVASFLVYARATTPVGSDTGDSPEEEAAQLAYLQHYGALSATIPASGKPADIAFSPVSIWSEQEAPAEAYAVAHYLTTIALSSCRHEGQAYSWSSTADSKLRAYYLNFINQGSQTTAPIAASTANARSYALALREQIKGLTFAEGTPDQMLCAAIIRAIDLTDELPADYPASVGLPAGAAVVRWTGRQFVPQTTTTTLAKIPTIWRYAFPAELYYYANSRMKTTTTDKRRDYYTSESNWNGVLSHYEMDNGVVCSGTTAVALKDPVQYAVGCLQVRLNPVSSAMLTDADGKAVAVRATSFPLTGLIVGSQRTVDYNFRPVSDSEVDVHYVYDSQPVDPDNSIICLPAGGLATANTNDAAMIPNDEYLFLTTDDNSWHTGNSYNPQPAQLAGAITAIADCEDPTAYLYQAGMDAQEYDKMITAGIPDDLTAAGPFYLRESDRQLRGTISYTVNGDRREAVFQMAQAGDFARNHTWVVYCYYGGGGADKLVVDGVFLKDWNEVNKLHDVFNW